jgi:hypothetical protein
MLADIFHAHLLTHHIPGHHIHATGGKIRTLGGLFVDLQPDITGGNDIGSRAGGAEISNRTLHRKGKNNDQKGNTKPLGLNFPKHKVTSFFNFYSDQKAQTAACAL